MLAALMSVSKDPLELSVPVRLDTTLQMTPRPVKILTNVTRQAFVVNIATTREGLSGVTVMKDTF